MTEQILESSRQFIRSLGNNTYFSCLRHDLDSSGEKPFPQPYQHQRDGHCYATIKMRPAKGVFLLGAKYHCKKGDEVGEMYWDWLTGKESPFRQLLVGEIEKVYLDNGDQMGYLIHKDMANHALGGKPSYWGSLFNLMIALRQQAESPFHINFWAHAVKNGVNPSDAFLMASFFSFDDNHITYNIRHGGHWPMAPMNLTYERWRDGELNESQPSTYAFMDTKHPTRPEKGPVPGESKIKKVPTTFGGLMYTYELKDIIEEFKDGNYKKSINRRN